MKKCFVLILFFFGFIAKSNSQLVLNKTLTPQQMANAISGPGVTIFNVNFTGDTSMKASFSATGTNLGINTGIMLATGDASFAIGPNVSNNAGADMYLPGDTILDSLANLYAANPIVTHDACILQFDFMAQSPTISFRYVFGSEEYPEYVCSQYNDVFAFFISGPGITGTQNMALIPSTTTPVAINTVNPGVPGSSGGTPGPNCGLGYSSLYVDNTSGPTIELDGFTVPLTASATIQPCKVYHIKLMIADAGDGAFDSGVFIEAGSFSSNPVVNAGPDLNFCSGASANIGAITAAGYTYNWSPPTGLSSSTVSNPTVTLTNTTASPITYSYVIIGNNGTCLFTDTVKVTVDPAPSASFTITPPTACAGQTMTVDYTGNAAGSYQWNFGSANVLSGSGAGPYQISFPNSGQDSISVIASSPGCSGNASQSVTISNNPVASFSLPPNVCTGDSLQISFNGTAGPTATYNWNFGGGQIHSGSGAGPYTASWQNPGLATVTLTVDDNGCLSQPNSLQVNVAPIPVAVAGNDTAVCPGYPVFLGSAGQAGYTYQWSPSTGLNDPTIANPTATINNAGNVSVDNDYILKVTSPIGCSSTDAVKVIINPGILVDFVTPPGKCMNGNSFDFSIQGSYPSGSTFQWNFGSNANPATSNLPTPQGVTFNALGNHNVVLNATSGSCSMPSVSHAIEIYPEPVFDFSADNLQACSPLNADMTLITDSTYTYTWQISNGPTSNAPEPLFTLTTPGQFDVSLTGITNNGCKATVTKRKYLTVHAVPTAQFTPTPKVASITAPIISFLNESINAQTYYWDFGDSTTGHFVNESHTYAKTGTYEIMLIATNAGGCIDTTRGFIEINEGMEFFIPNSFTPNGDGVNDFFQGYGINIKDIEMSIYDRWGKKIYETSEYFKPWDGRIKETVQNDVYVYRILVTDKMDEKHSYVGSVTVVR